MMNLHEELKLNFCKINYHIKKGGKIYELNGFIKINHNLIYKNTYIKTLSGRLTGFKVEHEGGIFLININKNTSFDVDWGDGRSEHVNTDGFMEHHYDDENTYVVTFTNVKGYFNFSNNETITKILTPLPKMETNEFSFYFNECTKLFSIPTNLFKYNPQIVDFDFCFNNCDIKKFNNNLFKFNINAITFSECFGYSYLTNIPENLFKYNTKVYNFSNCFKNCFDLTEIPENLFKHNTEVTDFSNCFYDCNQLTEIPEGLFTYNTKVTDFSNCFSSCKLITEIPENLFKHNTEAIDFGNCFDDCENLNTIPENLFKYNTQVVSFTKCFYNCIGLTYIPLNIFSYSTNSPSVNNSFQYCTNASNYNEIPIDWK